MSRRAGVPWKHWPHHTESSLLFYSSLPFPTLRGVTLFWADTATSCHPILSLGVKANSVHLPLPSPTRAGLLMAANGSFAPRTPHGLWCLHSLIIAVDPWLRSWKEEQLAICHRPCAPTPSRLQGLLSHEYSNGTA